MYYSVVRLSLLQIVEIPTAKTIIKNGQNDEKWTKIATNGQK